MKNIRKIRVVAATIVVDNRLFIAQRSEQMSSSLLWEVPGGKVEPGESDQEALVREIKEELDIDIEVSDFVGMSCVFVGDKEIEMYVYRSVILSGTPIANEHKQIMWASEEDLLSVRWSAADIPLIPQFLACIKGN
jgi:mutator protein MutT